MGTNQTRQAVARTTALVLTTRSDKESMMAANECSTPVSLELSIFVCLCIRREQKLLRQRQANAAYYAAHREQELARGKAYRAANPELIQKGQQAYKATHKNETKAYNATYYAAHREQEMARQKAYYAANPELIKEKARVYYAANPEKMQQRQIAYRVRNPERIQQREKAYRMANPELIQQRWKTYYKTNYEQLQKKTQAYRVANSERIRKRDKAYKAAHREHIRRRYKVYVQTHLEVYRAANQRRRARKLNAPINDFTPAQWRAMQDHYNHCCVYCGKYAKGKLTQDHITPLSKGGGHTNSNIVPSCKSCNSQKFTGPPLVPVQPLLLPIP